MKSILENRLRIKMNWMKYLKTCQIKSMRKMLNKIFMMKNKIKRSTLLMYKNRKNLKLDHTNLIAPLKTLYPIMKNLKARISQMMALKPLMRPINNLIRLNQSLNQFRLTTQINFRQFGIRTSPLITAMSMRIIQCLPGVSFLKLKIKYLMKNNRQK
jgi:hypothetical protein